MEKQKEQRPVILPIEYQFIINRLRGIHEVFELLTEDTTTTYLEKDTIRSASEKMVYSAIVYDLSRKMGLSNELALRLAILPLIPELSTSILNKSFKGFIANKLFRTTEEEMEEELRGEKKGWGWFRK